MKLIRLLVVLSLGISIAHAATGPSKVEAPPIKEVVSFGDSLTDAGSFWFRFTTNPGYTWAQYLALHYGQEPLPNQHVLGYSEVYKGKPGLEGPGGLNYAEGGARANHAYSQVSENPEGTPISATVQVQHFLKQHGAFKPDQLVTLYIGTNDVAYNYDLANDPHLAKQLRDNSPPSAEIMNREKQRVTVAAEDTAKVVQTILDKGAKRLVVLKLVDMGGLPWFRTQASQAFVSELSTLFNAELVRALPSDPRITVIDTPAFINGLVTNAKSLGFTHGLHEDACKLDEQDYCYPNAFKAPDADQTYIYAAGEHMTTKTNKLLADYVLEQLANQSSQ